MNDTKKVITTNSEKIANKLKSAIDLNRKVVKQYWDNKQKLIKEITKSE